jgi:hypothetical protein
LLEAHRGDLFQNGFDRLGNIGNAVSPASKRHESPLYGLNRIIFSSTIS